ncbi:MAG: TSUP family transporter, partial [Nannocystaceae bacterium]|nr:TSUP family transporter [Nannocystaceae bacterium]
LTLRAAVDRGMAAPMATGAFIGAAVGGWVTAALSASAIRWLLLGVSALAVARALGWLTIRPRRSILVPGGFGVGFAAATTGGGGLLLAPLMLAVGLTDIAFLATGTVVALAVHIGRVGSYASAGMLGLEHAGMAALLAIGLVLGNALGFRVRDKLTERVRSRATWGVLAVGIVLAMAGLAGPR